VAIVRAERIYPLPAAELGAELARYPQASEIIWVQEEPANMGAGSYMMLLLPGATGRPLRMVSRPACSAPAAGSAKKHAAEQARLIETAFAQES
jgi:multifunctional 2-oxoglutarate metabolism enzyme